MSDIVLLETENNITTVTMNRPDALNALSADLRQRLGEVFTGLKEDNETRVIILKCYPPMNSFPTAGSWQKISVPPTRKR